MDIAVSDSTCWVEAALPCAVRIRLLRSRLKGTRFKLFAASASARLYLKQEHFFGKQQVGHTGKVLHEGVHLLQNVVVFNISIGFHDEALSSTPTRQVAHLLHYPIEVAIKMVLHFSLPDVGRERGNQALQRSTRIPRLWHQLHE